MITSKLKQLAITAAAAGLICQCAAAETNRLIVFGDSLSDSGQAFDPAAAANDGTFQPLRLTTRVSSLNPFSEIDAVWVQYVADGLGVARPTPTVPYLGGTPGDNYAIAGVLTQAVKDSILEKDGNVLDVDDLFGAAPGTYGSRVGDGYLFSTQGSADANATYLVWAGGNDIRGLRDAAITDAAREVGAETAAQNIIDGVLALEAAGAQRILVGTLPDMGSLPESGAKGKRREGTLSSNAFNAYLSAGLSGSRAVILANMEQLLRTVQESPQQFGFSDEDHTTVVFTTAPLTTIEGTAGENGQLSQTSLPDNTDYVFSDGIHPSTNMHKIIADYSLIMLKGPVDFAPLAELGLSAMSQQEKSVEHQLRAASVASGKWRAFATGHTGTADRDADNNASEVDGKNNGATVGASYGVNDSLSLGLAVGYVSGDADLGQNLEVDLDGQQLHLHARWANDNGYVLWTGSYGSFEYETDRTIGLGPAILANQGDADGTYYGTKLEIGTNGWQRGDLNLSPRISLAYRENQVDSFTEAGDESTRYNIAELNREALVATIGLAADYALDVGHESRLLAGIALEHDFLADSDAVAAGLASLPGSNYQADAYDADDTRISATLGVEYGFSENVSGSVSLNYQAGENTENVGANIGLSYQF